MKKFILSILSITTFSGFAQTEPLLTKEQNASWLQELKRQELLEQLEMIGSRWEADSEIYYELTSLPHKKDSKREKKTKTNCRPFYVFQNEGDVVYFPPNPSLEVLTEVSTKLSPDNISNVEVNEGGKMHALYGNRASCGVIFIKVSKKAIFEEIDSKVRRKN